jgi:hypothetical protein
MTQGWLPFRQQRCPQSVNFYVHLFYLLWMFIHCQLLYLSMEENYPFSSFLTCCNWNVMFFIATLYLTIVHGFSMGFRSG